MKTVIVFGNDHTNTLGVIQSLGQVGYYCIGLLFGIKTDLVASSNYTKEVKSAPTPQECIDRLLEAIPYNGGNKIPIIPCSDIAALTLEQNAACLERNFIFEKSTKYSLSYLVKKENQVRLAESAGFNVPMSWNIQDTKEIPDDVTYPCLIKPLISSEGAKSDIRICHTKEELQSNLSSLVYTKNVLIQQYIERDYEISILGCGLVSGECIIPVVENKLTLYPKYVGLECLSDLQPLEPGPVKSSVERLITLIGYIGLFSVEMMHCKSDNKFYFTEINLRNDGAEAMVTKYGANLPLNHIEDILRLPITNSKESLPGFYIWDMHHFLSLVHGDISIFRWIKEIKSSNGFMLYFKEDKKPFYKQYSNWLLSKLHLRKDELYK